MFGWFKKKAPSTSKRFPPVPKWRPQFQQPLERVVERVAHYTNRKRDFAVFRHGTCVILPQNDLVEDQVAAVAKDLLDRIYKYHPDMTPREMDDGNIAIEYNQPALNVVLADFAKAHWEEIEANHQDALATSEVLMTPLGPNEFDDFGKRALFGRCYMFMDAQEPEMIRVVRAADGTSRTPGG